MPMSHSPQEWEWMAFTSLASLVVLVAAALWLIELLAGWPWRDRDHPLRDEIDRLEHHHPADGERE